MTLAQCQDILGPIRRHRDRHRKLTLDQRRASVEEIHRAAVERVQQRMRRVDPSPECV